MTGIFPEKLKIAKVKPLYKKGDKCCFNNYRPISILPTISKVFERVMYTQLYNYFNVNNLLTEQQYGFRSKHSTELASIKLVDYIIMEMDDPKTTKTPTTVYLDLSKAFDTLNYDIFVSKLEYYGIIGIALALIKSYLINRFQYVQYENMTSELLEIKTGIPQGSILGPLFFSILINDLVNSSRLFSFLMYADDTTIYFNLEDFPANNREIAINKELDKVLSTLTLNVEKTKCMFFRKKRTPEKISLSIDNKSIDAVSHFNFLGLLIDENLSWKYHITMVTNKLSKISGVLHRLKYIYPQHVLVAIYKSLFVPHLNYGSLLWGHNFDTVFKLQKKVVRTITNSAYIAHSEPILKRLSLLKVQDMYELKILNFFYKLYANDFPRYFDVYRPYLNKIETPYALRPHPLPVPQVAHVYAEASVVYKLVSMKNKIFLSEKLIWQKLEEQSHTLTSFSKYVTTKMLNKYSNICIKHPSRTCGRE